MWGVHPHPYLLVEQKWSVMYYNCGTAIAKKANNAKTPFHYSMCFDHGPTTNWLWLARTFPYFPWPLCNSLTFPGFPGEWYPCPRPQNLCIQLRHRATHTSHCLQYGHLYSSMGIPTKTLILMITSFFFTSHPTKPNNNSKMIKRNHIYSTKRTTRPQHGHSLWPPYGIGQAIMFSSCGFFLSSTYLFSSPNQRSQNGCLPYFDTWCGPSANLECRSKMCCTRLAGNAGPKIISKNRPSRHYRTTLSGYIFATKASIGNRKKTS